MATPADCTQNTDPLRLVHQGTSQEERDAAALDPSYAPVNEHTPAHATVFARMYSAFLRYYDSKNVPLGDWRPFFSEDVSVLLAMTAVQDIEHYKSSLKTRFDFLNDLENQSNPSGLKVNLGCLFSYAGAIARHLDLLKDGLPAEIPLKGTLQNLIQSRLAPALKQLFAWFKADLSLPPADRLIDTTRTDAVIRGGAAVAFSDIFDQGLSKDWSSDEAADWSAYLASIPADASVYGSGLTVFERINHIGTHNLFTSIFDTFLKVYARTINEARIAFEATLTDWDRHQPHYALFLASLRLFEYARAETNTLTRRHLDLYYREILRLKEKPPAPGRAHLLVELAKHAATHQLKAGELFKAGKDELGVEAFFANLREFTPNQAKVSALKSVYRHGNEPVGAASPTGKHQGRIFASPIANSDDGLGAPLTSADQSWHPFFNKTWLDGALDEIRMPKAELGFAVASHYLWMAEGRRWIWAEISVTGYTGAAFEDYKDDITCLLTSEKGWLEKAPLLFFPISTDVFWLLIEIGGGDAPITPYSAKIHGYTFDTDLPLLLVKLKNDDADLYAYPIFQDIVVTGLKLHVFVADLKTLAVSNDFGPVDASKPFQPYGALPKAGNALIIGSKEIFQKSLVAASVDVNWLTTAVAYKETPSVDIDFLKGGKWTPSNIPASTATATAYPLTGSLQSPVVDEPDLMPNEFYNTASRHGFVRLRLKGDLGQDVYQADLIKYLRQETTTGPSPVPAAPSISELSMNYWASQTLTLNVAEAEAFSKRQARYFHLAPFGQSEQHPRLRIEAGAASTAIHLFPQFYNEQTSRGKQYDAEFYIGLSNLHPPQNLAVLFQVADGTANPLSQKPDQHINWSYLRGNEWAAFAENAVEDQTGGLLDSGIITFAVPRDASNTNTILPAGMHWIRAAVASKSDAVCRLLAAAAQAFEVVFTDRGNAPSFAATPLPAGTITKPDQPDAAVKKFTQPFATSGGRGAELPRAFYTRISERLRHKDRAIAMWDYERLVLEAFPEIYKAKCLNHTHYQPDDTGAGVYRELAPGHVTIVTIPQQQFQNLRDPLRPYTSLGLLQKIADFLRQRLSCFVKLHVENPQFEEVRVAFDVRFHDGIDEGFHLRKLQEELVRFLSPWAFPGGGAPSFDGRIYKSALINFAEERPYVDYVTDFKLFHDIGGVPGTNDKNEVEGSKAVSILVSVPAGKHEIRVIKPAQAEAPREICPCET